ncbi:MAG TPA: hypothetical protein VE153_10300, partial [Myxococcus sp.]|nr:hypothetical protein [Myxococcus sp.]
MCAETSRAGWAALVCAVLLASGCTTLAPHPPHVMGAQVLGRMAGSEYPGEALSPGSSSEPDAETRVHRRRGGRELGSAVARGVPPGWPDFSSGDAQRLLAPFLACASPAEFVALQRQVDMPRLVEALDDWSAVRLGALGPMRAEAAAVLTRKRASLLLDATEKYGLARAEVFALFILHSAFDDELRELLRLLSRDKQLGETLGKMGAVREGLGRRGLKLPDLPDRTEKPGDSLRGLGRAARDALSSSPMSDGARYLDFSAR